MSSYFELEQFPVFIKLHFYAVAFVDKALQLSAICSIPCKYANSTCTSLTVSVA
jgi:hypothetical protein